MPEMLLGKGGISAKIILDSITESGSRLTTFEFVYPRFILPEFNTHRMLSKNTASTRAVPVANVMDMVKTNPAKPVHWGKNMPGMSAAEELDALTKESAEKVWESAAKSSVNFTEVLSSKVGINGHKQWVGRLLEPFAFTKQVVSGTEWENFFWLRDHKAAQPEFRELARLARMLYDQSIPTILNPGEWHLPYINKRNDNTYWCDDEPELSLEDAKMISVSCCAQVSYRNNDLSIEKAHKIFSMLNISSTDNPSHASPLEHQATPMKPFSSSIQYGFDPTVFGVSSTHENVYINSPVVFDSWEPGITHARRDETLWSGNFKGWIQYRQTIPNEAVW